MKSNPVSIKDQIIDEIIHEIQRKFWDQCWDEKLETGTNALTRGMVYSKIRMNVQDRIKDEGYYLKLP